MQYFDRSNEPPPSTLQSEEAFIHRKELANYFLLEKSKRAQTRAPHFSSGLDRESMNSSLRRLFHDKCAFCESLVATIPYRFRPPSDASPMARNLDAHLYYTWLSSAWENFYPLCSACVPKKHSDYFPVRGKRAALPTRDQLNNYANEALGLWRDHPPKEKALLLDPCASKSFTHHFNIDLYGILFARTDYATATIDHFDLNRSNLCEARARRLSEYLDNLCENIDRQLRDRVYDETGPFDFAKLEFGGSWYLMCCDIVLFLSPGNPHRWPLSPKQIPRTLRKAVSRLDVFDREKLEAWLNDSLRNLFTDDSFVSRGFTDVSPTLTTITLTDFKGIEDLQLVMPKAYEPTLNIPVPVQPAMLILGENAAGKSSILEALALALATDEGRNELRLDLSTIPLHPQLMGVLAAPQRASAKVTLTFDDDTTRTLTITNGQYEFEGDPGAPAVFAYGAFRQYQKKKNSRYNPTQSISNLFQSDKLLSNPEQWLLGLDEFDFISVIRVLRIILSIEGNFDVLEKDLENQRCLIVTATGANTICRTPLSLASSGYRSVLAMVCDILKGLMSSRLHVFVESLESAQAVVLIDEIEAHLHPRWKIQIMQALRRALPKITFIATTHDPLCLRGMQDNEVVVMQRVLSDEGSEWPVMVERVVNVPSVSQLTIEQLLTSDLFSLASTDQPETERELALFADLLAARESGRVLTEAQDRAWKLFENDVRDALPVGTTEVQRLVQEAVVTYLKERRRASAKTLESLRRAAKDRIVDILRTL